MAYLQLNSIPAVDTPASLQATLLLLGLTVIGAEYGGWPMPRGRYLWLKPPLPAWPFAIAQ